MDRQILLTALAFLAFGMALNLHLSLAVLRRQRMQNDVPAAPVPGDLVPQISSRRLGTRSRQPLLPESQACALLFLSSKCDKCRAHLPEVAAMLPAAAAAGLEMRIVSIEPGFRLRHFLAGAPLAAAVHQLRTEDYKRLNPRFASPAYMFVNHQAAIEATGLIGDDNWRQLCTQLAHSGTEEEAAA
jgi:hypothetical protein